jgi:hypothetical protein
MADGQSAQTAMLMPQGFWNRNSNSRPACIGVHGKFISTLLMSETRHRGTGRCGQDFAAGEVVTDTGVEVRTSGFGPRQFLKRSG